MVSSRARNGFGSSAKIVWNATNQILLSHSTIGGRLLPYNEKLKNILGFLENKSIRGDNFNDLTSVILDPRNVQDACEKIVMMPGVFYKNKRSGDVRSNLVFDFFNKTVVENVKRGTYKPQPVLLENRVNAWGKEYTFSVPEFRDCILQQCIFSVINSIVGPKFSDSSFYRPGCNYSQAIARVSNLVNHYNNFYLIPLRIENAFKNVNHNKLKRQVWALGIHDKKFLWLLSAILRGSNNCRSGVSNSGLLSNMLINIALNELDTRIDGMWCDNPVVEKYSVVTNPNGSRNKFAAYNGMRNRTRICEVRIVRFLDEVLLVCKTEDDAHNVLDSILKWVKNRLGFSVSGSVFDLRNTGCDFLGFHLKAIPRSKKSKLYTDHFVLRTSVSKDAVRYIGDNLKDNIKKIQHSSGKSQAKNIAVYNRKVLAFHDYFGIATMVSRDFGDIAHRLSVSIKNRLGSIVSRKIRGKLSPLEAKLYGDSKQIRFFTTTMQPLYPIGCIKFRILRNKPFSSHCKKETENEKLHDGAPCEVKVSCTVLNGGKERE